MTDTSPLTRKTWMATLAKASPARLATLFPKAPPHRILRQPEIGALMVRGRMGGTGAAFNLGEMTVTRCALRLGSGQVGHAYVAGRSHAKARIAALCDALLQDDDQAAMVRGAVLAPLAEAAAQARETLAAKAAATRVEFFTLARERG